jgi:hypothetical protein
MWEEMALTDEEFICDECAKTVVDSIIGRN